jgi:flagella basal body P-ring formation protein FlgA
MKFALLLILTLFHALSLASPRQDLSSINAAAEAHLQEKTSELSDTVNIFTEPLDKRINLAPCNHLHAFIPQGGRLSGKTSVGIKCISGATWTIYVQATVQIISDYVVTAAPIASGQIITPEHLTVLKGDLSTLPTTVVTDVEQALGRTAGTSIRSGTPLRLDALKSQPVVKQGQQVRLISTGPSFQVSIEGTALNSATVGQTVRVKTPNGQSVSGIAKAGGTVEVRH